MGTLKWYKRDPNAALTGMMGLTLAERGAYNTILDLIYAHDGAVEDNAHDIARWMGVNAGTWKRLRQSLLDRGKIYVHGGKLRNLRADRETELALEKIKKLTSASLQRWATHRHLNRLADPYGVIPTSRPTKLLSFLEAHKLDKSNKKPSEKKD